MGAFPEIPQELQWVGVLATFVGGVFVAIISYAYKLGAAANAHPDRSAISGAAIVDSTAVEGIGTELARLAVAAERLAAATEALAALAKKTADDADRARDRSEIMAPKAKIDEITQERRRPAKP